VSIGGRLVCRLHEGEIPMQATIANISVPAVSTKRRWGSFVASGVPTLFLVFDAAMKLVKVPPVVEAMDRLGYPDATARPIGLVLLACVVLYVVPRTAVLGAVLLTGYLGGAIATHVRVADPFFTHTIFPVYVAALVWLGLYLRDARVRAMIGRAR
jgi:hypothetical protein